MKSTELTKCIVTGSNDLIPVINLGDLYPSAFINSPLDERKFQKKQFVVNFCEDGGMVQLKWVNDYDDMFKEYWYRSATNSQMKKSLSDVVTSSLEKHNGATWQWLDIAANDGTLSQIVKEINGDIHIVGVDPALNLNHKGSDTFVNDYFSAKAIQGKQIFSKFDIITNIAMFYDLQDPHPFLDDVKSVLADDGIYVVQMTDLYGMIKSNAVDNFCHEHVAYYSLEAIDKLLKMHGLEIFDLEYNLTNGSSLRIYASHSGGSYVRREMVDMLIEYQKRDITSKAIVDWYNHDICRNLYIFNRWLERQKKAGKSIALIGASTKGNTLLQMCNLDRSTIDYAMELTPIKYGKFCLGSNIPIVEEKYALITNPPDICVAMIWHFKDSILKNFKSYIDNGGSVLFPLPKPVLYTKDGIEEIK